MDTALRTSDRNGLTVLLVDDQRLFVESLRVYMNTRAPDLEVVGVAYDGEEAVSMAEALLPDLVVMDVRMPVMDGVEASKVLSERLPDVRVLMLTTFDDDSYVFEALKNGAVGYLLKDLDPANLVEAMRAAISGSIQISPKIADKLVSGTSAPLRRTPPPTEIGRDAVVDIPADGESRLSAREAWEILSRREREIILLVARGLENREIAEALHIALQTVKNRVSDIYIKLDVHSRVHLIRLCRIYGWDRTST